MNHLSVTCPTCDAPPEAQCVTRMRDPDGNLVEYSLAACHESRHTMSRNPRELSVPCPGCSMPAGTLCVHKSRGAPHWNKHCHPERDKAAYAACTDVVPGLTHPDGSSVKWPWVTQDARVKKDGLRVLKFDNVGVFYPQAFWACTWGTVWYASIFSNAAKRMARGISAVDRLADLARAARTIWDQKTREVMTDEKDDD